MTTEVATYAIDSNWTIVRANEAFCRIFRCAESGLIGRDVRDLMREDWRPDFRTYVARALVGVGDVRATVPMVAPCGQQGWFNHTLEPQLDGGVLTGYTATITPHIIRIMAPVARWWQWRIRSQQPRRVWDFDVEPFAKAS